MIKKIFALVMVISVLGIFAAGCKKDDDAAAPAATAGTATTTGTAPAATATTGESK